MKQAIKGLFTLWLLVFTLIPGGAAATRRAITEKDFLRFTWVADPQISPDGGRVAYVLVTVNEKEDRYDTSLWIISTAGGDQPRRLTAGPRDSSPRWSPDGSTLAFNRAGEREPPQIHLLSLAGGEAVKLTDLPKGASPAVWSPDGKTIAFATTTTAEDLEQKKKGGTPPKKSDVRVVTRAVYRFNGGGWLDPSEIPHIWTVRVESNRVDPAEAKQITSGAYGEGGVEWSHDCKRIYFISNRVDEPYYYPADSNAYSVEPAGGEPRTLIDIDGPVGDLAPSPDGGRFAFSGFINPPKEQSHKQSDVFVFAGGKATNLTEAYDYEIGSSVAGDQRPPRGGGDQPLVWTPDGKSLILATTEHGRGNFVKIDVAAARVEPLSTGDHDVIAYTAVADASKFAVTMTDTVRVCDLFLFEPATKKFTQLTHHNDTLFSELDVKPPEEIWYTSFDGKKINGWILKPPDFDASKKYPMILQIHGGPHVPYGHTMYHEMLWMAAKGYVVLFINPRGSTSYGQEFSNIIQYRYPGDDYKDLMAGVDEVIKRGYVDDQRLGVTGGSGGGLLTNWTVTQTNRFKAAVSQRSVADWLGFWYTADFSLFTPTWFRSVPFRDPEEFLARSPVRYADKITTPMMFVEGDSDLRTPPTQGGEAMFRALKVQKKVAVMVRFPGETHDLSRSGKPAHRVERLQHIVNWFDKYLMGKDIRIYDQK
ncbi:MAG TPA: S9 family peptidase [Blastocatellia bacterium]|nr:S9 family peptidase [Blastocatellia bacterium]